MTILPDNLANAQVLTDKDLLDMMVATGTMLRSAYRDALRVKVNEHARAWLATAYAQGMRAMQNVDGHPEKHLELVDGDVWVTQLHLGTLIPGGEEPPSVEPLGTVGDVVTLADIAQAKRKRVLEILDALEASDNYSLIGRSGIAPFEPVVTAIDQIRRELA